MGSGCGNNTSYGGCTEDQQTSSHCVSWQGETYANLGVCRGDTLTEVGEVVLKKLEDFAKGEGISLKTLTAKCESVEVKLKNTDYSLYQILKLILDSHCDLETAVSTLNAKVDDLKITLDGSQLCPSATTQQQIQQCVIDSVVELQKGLNNIINQLGDVVNNTSSINTTINNSVGNFLLDRINSCNGGIQKNGSGSTATLDLVGIVPPGGYIWGEFDLSKFSSTGIGNDIYCGYALANGRNGTYDMRNEIPSMASTIQGVTRSFTYNTNYGDRRGSDQITLKSNQTPPHEHTIQQTPHSHGYNYQGNIKHVGRNSGSGEQAGDINNITSNTQSANANVEVKGVKGLHGQPIDIRQSTRYLVWIKRITGFTAVNNPPVIIAPSVSGGGFDSGVVVSS